MSYFLGGSSGPASEAGAPDDEHVVARVLAGDSEAYAILVRRHQAALFRFALGMVGSHDAAADIAQDSLVKAYTGLSGCRDAARFGPWVRRIVRNRCLDYLKDRRRQNVSIENETLIAGDADETESRVYRDELRRTVAEALEGLPDSQREAFLLKHLEDRSYEEMAEMLDASVSALKMRVKRAREALQLALGRSIQT
ncbi:MAG: RNA polymerase sigma factor [Gemmatimonadota bacterium]